jgi:hypothetical protein
VARKMAPGRSRQPRKRRKMMVFAANPGLARA